MRGAIGLSFLVTFAAACSSGGASSAPGLDAGAEAGRPSGSPSPSDEDVAPPPSQHTPTFGCREGFRACGTVCADLQTDPRHCGACGQACRFVDGGSTACVKGVCVPTAPGSCNKLTCDTACVSSSGIDHCGSCFNECFEDELCVKEACVDANGDGATCDSALSATDDEALEFRYTQGVRDTHQFRCGGALVVQTRWFKWTAKRDQKVTFEVQGGGAGDEYLIEAFDASGCADSSFVSCGSGGLPEINVQVTAGKTYFIAIGQVNAPSGKLAAFRVDT